MKHKLRVTIFSLITFAATSQAFAGLMFNYSQLALKDLDQMSKIVREKVVESNKTKGNKAIPLKEGLQAVFSRPNDDGMIEKLISPLKSGLDELDAWEPTLRQLVKESIGALQNPKAFKPVVQVTYLVFLENLMSELQPKAQAEFEGAIIKQIQSANIVLTSQAKNERVLRMMRETRSPSEIATEILLAKSAATAAESAQVAPSSARPSSGAAPKAEASVTPTPAK